MRDTIMSTQTDKEEGPVNEEIKSTTSTPMQTLMEALHLAAVLFGLAMIALAV